MKRLILACGLVAASAGAVAGTEARFNWSAAELASADGVVATFERVQRFSNSYCREHLRGSKGIAWQMSCKTAVTEELLSKIGDQRLTVYAETGEVDAGTLAAR